MASEISCAKKAGIQVFSPGLDYYVQEILSGIPFTLVRYGEGEWRTVVPSVPHKTFHGPLQRQVFQKIWNDPKTGAEEMLRAAILNHHDHERYWAAMWHFKHLKQYHWLPTIKRWQDKKLGKDIVWHDGSIWRVAIEKGVFYPVIAALREQRLPIVVVGPGQLTGLGNRLPIHDHILIDRWGAFYEMDMMEEEMLKQPPCLFILCGAGPAKIVANKLFPEIGEQSTMIDFGASWEGLLGHPARRYFREMSKEKLEQNWSEVEEEEIEAEDD